MTLLSLQIRLPYTVHNVEVSTINCSDVYEYKRTIKKALSPELDSYSYDQLTLYQPDGTTKIPVETLVGDLKEDACGPMVVLVKNSIAKPGAGSPRQELVYKKVVIKGSTYFPDAIAQRLALAYDFKWADANSPTMGDVLLACKENEWQHRLQYRSEDVPIRSVALPDVLEENEWNLFQKLHCATEAHLVKPCSPNDDDCYQEMISFFKTLKREGRFFDSDSELGGSIDSESDLEGSTDND